MTKDQLKKIETQREYNELISNDLVYELTGLKVIENGKTYYTVPPIPPAQAKPKSMKHLETYGYIDEVDNKKS